MPQLPFPSRNNHQPGIFPFPSRRRLLVVHQGALGDFLNAWSSLFCLRQALPETAISCLVRPAHRALVEQAGLNRASVEDERSFHLLYGESEPAAFADATILWLGMASSPDIRHNDLHFLPGIRAGETRPPRELWLEGLSRLGIRTDADWLGAWRAKICRAAGPANSERALLFPGAGHPLKTWPLVQFIELAEWLESRGLEPRFILGPQECERGLDIAGWPSVQPRDLEELLEEMRQGALCVGADSGPMHMASLCGLPGIALFGPTSAAQWGPHGLIVVRGACPRRPCTVTTADLRCPEAKCMASISQSQARQALLAVLNGIRSG